MGKLVCSAVQLSIGHEMVLENHCNGFWGARGLVFKQLVNAPPFWIGPVRVIAFYQYAMPFDVTQQINPANRDLRIRDGLLYNPIQPGDQKRDGPVVVHRGIVMDLRPDEIARVEAAQLQLEPVYARILSE